MLVLAGQNRKMGCFGSFLYINDFFGDESYFGCPPFVVFNLLCGSVHVGGALNRRVPELQVGSKGPGASV